jgi:hypothetical protein
MQIPALSDRGRRAKPNETEPRPSAPISFVSWLCLVNWVLALPYFARRSLLTARPTQSSPINPNSNLSLLRL